MVKNRLCRQTDGFHPRREELIVTFCCPMEPSASAGVVGQMFRSVGRPILFLDGAIRILRNGRIHTRAFSQPSDLSTDSTPTPLAKRIALRGPAQVFRRWRSRREIDFGTPTRLTGFGLRLRRYCPCLSYHRISKPVPDCYTPDWRQDIEIRGSLSISPLLQRLGSSRINWCALSMSSFFGRSRPLSGCTLGAGGFQIPTTWPCARGKGPPTTGFSDIWRAPIWGPTF